MDTVDAALRVLADAIRPLKADERASIADSLGHFGRNPDNPLFLDVLLTSLVPRNAGRQSEAPVQSYSSDAL